jgi:hypothetical protein
MWSDFSWKNGKTRFFQEVVFTNAAPNPKHHGTPQFGQLVV